MTSMMTGGLEIDLEGRDLQDLKDASRQVQEMLRQIPGPSHALCQKPGDRESKPGRIPPGLHGIKAVKETLTGHPVQIPRTVAEYDRAIRRQFDRQASLPGTHVTAARVPGRLAVFDGIVQYVAKYTSERPCVQKPHHLRVRDPDPGLDAVLREPWEWEDEEDDQ